MLYSRTKWKEATMVKGKIVLIVVLTALLALVIAGCFHRTPEQRAEHVVKHLVDTLKLNAAQTEKLGKIKDEFLAKQAGLRTMREDSVKEAGELMVSPQIDQAALNAHIEKSQAKADDLIRF